jgi:hypothetical protein
LDRVVLKEERSAALDISTERYYVSQARAELAHLSQLAGCTTANLLIRIGAKAEVSTTQAWRVGPLEQVWRRSWAVVAQAA